MKYLIFLILGCHDAWTVLNESVQKTGMHSFMILAQETSTIVSKE